MSTPTDKEIAWQGRIQERAATASKAILDRLERYPKSGFANLAPADRRDIAEHVSKQVIDTMMSLGTFVTAGAQDFQVATLSKVTITGADKVKLEVVPAIADGKPVNLDLLAQNSGKQVVVAFINGVAYQQARDALSKAIAREQTDWVHREQDRDASDAERQQAAHDADEAAHPPGGGYPEGGNVIEGTATAVVADIHARAEGDLIADQPGDTNGIEEASETPPEQSSGEEARVPDDGPAAGGSGEGAEGPASSDPHGDPDEPPAPAPTRKRRASRAGWPGHH